ncbi:hypothetical protein ACF0H5_017623 [Mactra antiquata]
MPALKLTEDLFCADVFRSFNFKGEVTDGVDKEIFNGVLTARNAKEQINVLKKATQIINDRIQTNITPSTVAIETSLQFLTSLMFVTTSNNPIRRFLKSYFLGLPIGITENIVKPKVIQCLCLMCGEELTKATHDDNKDDITNDVKDEHKLSDLFKLRHNVDAVACLIENFSIGEECLQDICEKLLPYLTIVQEHFYHTLSKFDLSLVEQNQVAHHILETTKLINRICQRSVVAMTTMKHNGYLYDESKFPSKLFQIDTDVLQTDSSLQDCKITCSMNIWLLLIKLASTDVLLSMSSMSIFCDVDWLVKSCDHKQSPDWLRTIFEESLSRDKLSVSSYLCCCYGFLAVVDMTTLTTEIQGNNILLDCLLNKFLELSQSCTDTGGKLLAAKSVSLLVQRLRDFCSTGCLPSALKMRLHGEKHDLKRTLEFVWTSWEHCVDALRYTVKDIFENVVFIHLYCSEIPAKEDPFLLQLLRNIMNDVSWTCKGKYPTLSVLVGQLGSSRILQMNPGIAGEILSQMQEQTLACYATDLYENLFKSYKQDLETSGDVNITVWCDSWLKPVLNVLCGHNKIQKKHTIEYILPKILNNEPSAMKYIIPELSKQKSNIDTLQNEDGQLGALIMCLRRSRVLGQLKSNTDGNHGNKDMWCGIVDVKLLQQALNCKDEQIRLDALALLCENQKTTEVIGDLEFQLISNFIPNNMTNQNPAFRQHFLSLLKKFLNRIKESSCALLKKIKKDKQCVIIQDVYKDFLCWLTRCLFNCLYPGSVFARRSTSLEALSLLMKTFDSFISGVSSELQYNFYLEVTSSDITSLLFCITDTFEENKNMAANILISCTKHSSSEIMNEVQIEELLEISISLSESTRPQDSMTAAYLLSVLIHQPSLYNVLKQKALMHISDDESSSTDLAGCDQDDGKEVPKKEAKVVTINSNKENKMADEENMMTYDSHNVADFNDVTKTDDEYCDVIKPADDTKISRRYLLLCILLRSLTSQMKTAKKSLVIAAANKPLYPTIQCMRYCFNDVEFSKIPQTQVESWRILLSRFVSLCCEISSVVSPIVCNSSPEGNVPMETLEGVDSSSDSLQTVTLMPEYLLVCCWRSVKEMSLLLGWLTANVTIATSVGSHGLLNYEQIMIIKDFFQKLLLESKHRGAFELAYAGFVKLIEMLWKNSDPVFHMLPSQLLSDVMTDIKSNDVNSKLCATRRSAGLPFYVLAIVSTEPVGRQSFKRTMEELLCLGLDETITTEDKSTAKVHALNILRALFKDSKLRDDVSPYVADGLKVAILGFKSPLWAVRNSATLLMTAMMTRIFGVKRSKDESTFNRKNCQTGRTFFYHYPSLYQFLLDEIVMATEHVTKQLHPGLYPILMVLGRLFPSSMEGTDTSLNLGAFIPYIIRCSGNPVLKTRVMAAKAIQPLVDKDHVILIFDDLLTLLPCQQSDILHQNHIHGILLQMCKLLETIPTLPSTIRMSVSELMATRWLNIMKYLSTRNNPCLLTREVTLRLTYDLVQHFPSLTCFIPLLYDTLTLEVNEIDTVYKPCSPGLSQFQVTVCTLWCDLTFHCDLDLDNMITRYAKSVDSSIEGQNMDLRPIENLETNMNCNQHSDWSDVQIENVILKLLSSRSYDVREIILQKLLMLQNNGNACGQQCSNSKIAENDEKISGQTHLAGQGKMKCQGHSKVKVVTRSRNIILHLLSMIEEEWNEICQIELLSLLDRWWDKCMYIDRGYLLHVLYQLVTKMKDENCSDALLSARISFHGTAIYYLLSNSLSEGRSENKVDDNDELFYTVVSGFIQILQVQTGHVETNTEVLLSCAQSILKNCQYFLGTSQNGAAHYIDADIMTSVFRCVLDLLHADDLEVRETASSIVTQVNGNASNGSVCQPYIAVTELLDYWISLSKLNDTDNTKIRCLFDVMFEHRQNDLDYEERLFDRGEINTYWDEFDFIQRLDMAIDNNKELFISKLTQDTDIKPQKTSTDNSCDNNVPTLRTIFLDTQTYQEHVLTVLKQSIANKYMYNKLMLNMGYNIEDEHFTLLMNGQDWKSSEAQNVWPSVLVHLMKRT